MTAKNGTRLMTLIYLASTGSEVLKRTHFTRHFITRHMGLKPHSKCKLRSLNPILDQNGILRACGRLQFAPDELEIEKCPINLHAKDTITRLYLEHAHRICIHQGTEPSKRLFSNDTTYLAGESVHLA